MEYNLVRASCGCQDQRGAVREFLRTTEGRSLPELDCPLTAKERRECFDNDKKGCQAWYGTDPHSLWQQQVETLEYHWREDRDVEAPWDRSLLGFILVEVG